MANHPTAQLPASDLNDAEVFHQILDNLHDVIWMQDVNHTTTCYVSRAYETLFDRTCESVYRDPRSFLEAIHEDDRDLVRQAMPMQAAGNYDVEYRLVRRDGTIRWVRSRAFPVRDADGNVVRLAGIVQDITEARQTQDKLKRREAWFRALFEHTHDLITVMSPEGERLFHSPSVERVLGYGQNELIGLDTYELIHPEDRARVKRVLTDLTLEPGTVQRYDVRLRKRNGSYAYCESSAVYLPGQAPNGTIILCSRDVTDLRLTDRMTGLPSEVFLVESINMRLKRGEQFDTGFALASIGIDRMQSVRESLGDFEAERLIALCARRLEQAVGPRDIVAKLPGDQFAVLMDAAPGSAAVRRLGDRLDQVFEEPFESEAGPITLTVSMGMVVAPQRTNSAQELLRSAAATLEKAMQEGTQRRKLYDAQTHKHTVLRMSLETELKRGVRNGEIRAYFQPLIELQTGRLVGFEALARWARPGGEVLVPGQFIAAAEESRLICEIDFAVMRDACRQAVAWLSAGVAAQPFAVSVNLSARHFEQPGLADHVAAILEQTGLPAACLKLELTESAMMESPDSAVDVIRETKALGVQFGMDDFGTGYSSLSYLSRFPFDTLKIDRSFVSTLGTPNESPELVRAIIGMARGLGLTSVAEGVETPAQRDFLREAGCEVAQGYLFAQPLSAEAAEDLARRGRCERE